MTSEALTRLKQMNGDDDTLAWPDVWALMEDFEALELAYLALFNAPCRHCGMTPAQAALPEKSRP